jgi:hypothetical protein
MMGHPYLRTRPDRLVEDQGRIWTRVCNAFTAIASSII